MVLATYMSLLVNVTLTAIAWGSLLTSTPFTIQYAREQVAPELWHSPAFLRVNQYIIAVWGFDFFLSALISVYRRLSADPSLAWRYAWVARPSLSSGRRGNCGDSDPHMGRVVLDGLQSPRA
jgi:hypothetical protein